MNNYPWAVKVTQTTPLLDSEVLVYVEARDKHEAEKLVKRMYRTQFKCEVVAINVNRLNHLQEFYSNDKSYFIP